MKWTDFKRWVEGELELRGQDPEAVLIDLIDTTGADGVDDMDLTLVQRGDEFAVRIL